MTDTAKSSIAEDVLQKLQKSPLHISELCASSGYSIEEIKAALQELLEIGAIEDCSEPRSCP